MAFLTADLSNVPPAVRQRMHEILTNENAMALVQAKIRQQQAAKFVRDQRPRSIDGIGGVSMTVDPYFENYFRMKYGTSPVEDPHFRAWLKRQGEDQFFVTSSGTKIQISSPGMPGKRTFKKTY